MKKITLLTFFCICISSLKAQTNQSSVANNGKVWASLYQQRAAEYKALCFQAYNIARLRLDIALRKHHAKPYAVVTDIDETLLDNSPYDASQAVNNKEFDIKAWKDWTGKGIADTVPGAPSFFKYAASRGVVVYYITNRDEDELPGTLKNLKQYRLPYADANHVMLRGKKSSKELRRQYVLKTHEIVLLCGDNLPDFDALYDNHPTEANRAAITEKLKKQFGNKYIVLPNVSYGDFENAFFDNRHLGSAQKDSIIKAKLKVE